MTEEESSLGKWGGGPTLSSRLVKRKAKSAGEMIAYYWGKLRNSLKVVQIQMYFKKDQRFLSFCIFRYCTEGTHHFIIEQGQITKHITSPLLIYLCLKGTHGLANKVIISKSVVKMMDSDSEGRQVRPDRGTKGSLIGCHKQQT